MKRSSQIALAGLLLLALAALSTFERGSVVQKGEAVRGACCPLVQSLKEMSPTTSTNRPEFIDATNSHPATNHP